MLTTRKDARMVEIDKKNCGRKGILSKVIAVLLSNINEIMYWEI